MNTKSTKRINRLPVLTTVTREDRQSYLETRYSSDLTFPPDLVRAINKHRLNRTEMLLLATVGKHRDDVLRIGCWLSTGDLAKLLGVQERMVAYAIDRTKRLGLLKHVGWVMIENKRYRVLETGWGRP